MSKEELTIGQLLNLFFYLVNALLTVYLLGLFVQKDPAPEIVGIFRKIRTYFYLVYLLLLFLLGLKITRSQKKVSSGEKTNPGLVEKLLVSIAINLVLTTFAFEVAKTSYDILLRLGIF